MHEKEIENLNDKINDKDTLINELKDTHEKEIENLKNQLILKEKSDKEPKSRKRADKERKTRKRADQEPKSRKDKLNINSSRELIDNIKQLINDLYDN